MNMLIKLLLVVIVGCSIQASGGRIREVQEADLGRPDSVNAIVLKELRNYGNHIRAIKWPLAITLAGLLVARQLPVKELEWTSAMSLVVKLINRVGYPLFFVCLLNGIN